MVDYDYDLLVIGAGSGGVAASRRAAAHGAKVAICESSRVGGTCVIRGCVPKKLFVYASHFREEFSDAAGFGWTLPEAPVFDWKTLVKNKDTEITRLSDIYLGMLQKSGVTLIAGHATFVDKHTVLISKRHVTARYILIATGGWPVMPGIPGIEHAISSNEAFDLDALPKKMVIVGGGYIAVEFAGIFHGLGVDVTVLYRGEQILRGFDDDLRHKLAEGMQQKGVTVRTQTNLKAIRQLDDRLAVIRDDGSEMETDSVMFATGRVPNIAGLNLEAAGVQYEVNGAIKVNGYSQTNIPHIYAVGDVTDRINLTPVAINEGRAFADTVFGNQPRAVDYATIPSAVFSQPSVATVGLTEVQAREQYSNIAIYRSDFRPLKHTLSGNGERIFMKLVVDETTDKVLGAHMVGADAAEIIQSVAIALKCGATKAQFDATMALHPSAAEEFVTMREKYIP